MNRTKQLIISLIALLCCSTGAWAEGELKGLFTINDNGDKVQFSQGNLQATYDGSDWSWAFAKNQWDYIGNAAANTSINGNGTVSTNGTVDLFNVSTSATTYGIHNSTSYETYYGDFVDWGNNMGDGWRTLASNEWKYILSKRNSGSTVFSTGNACYTHATINTDGTPVNGIILFPDGVTIARSEVTSCGSVNGNSEWGTKCTSAQWTALEAKGCVFLPAAGYRYGASVSYTGDNGYYLSSTIDTWEKSEWPVCFSSNDLTPSGGTSRHLGCSVRLVKDRQLNKDAEGYYLLGTVDDWRYFAAHVAAGYSGAKARMTADIDLGDDPTTIGSGNTNAANENFMFRGVFDGNGHTLTVNYNTSEGFYAPFRHIYGATIKNLHVTGSIISSGGRVGGIVCGVFGGSSTQSKIEKCRSSVVITSNCQLSNNDAESVGGIVGQVGFSSRLSIEDCIFDGEITGHVSNVIWSGLVGVLDGTVNTTRCLQAGSFSDLDNGTTANSATIVCRWQGLGTLTMDETYYIHPFKTVQGTQATTAQLADGTITTALNAGRTGDETVWVQQGDRPMLKIFASKQEPEEYQQGGELNGLFTINANGDQIVFSQGNLQYFCSTTAPQWRFAEHQYDYVAFDISAYAANSGKWIDLFAHGTSGYDNGQTNFQPYVIGAAANTYYQGNLTGNADWGYNAISNGGNTENCGWRTLTRDEWIYLFSGRPNAASKYGHGSINGINGMILLPDSWTLPDGLTFTPGNQAWGKNTYTIDQWTMMEDAGAVFLPASGSCNSQGIPSESTQNQNGFYRASTAAYYLHFRQGTLQNCTASFYQYGDAVRLVKDYQLEQDCTLQQDAEGYYLLGSVQEWKDFAALVQTTPTAKARMTADIDLGTEITMIAEDLDHPYKGTFDGQGHTLTVNWTADGEDRVAPFRYAEGATIQRLHVDGSISKTGALGRCPAGILACSIGNTTTIISECWSSVSLYAYDTIGGLLSVACGNSTTNIVDCMFSGMISASNSTGCSGGFASHADKEYQYNTPGTPTVNITRGLNLGTFSGGNTLSYTFIRMGNPVFGTHTVNSCYYKNVYGNAQGAQATTAQLSDGTITTALNAGRTGDDAVWVQQDDQPMLKIFTQESDPVEPTGWENGVLPGEFTINANGDQIVFSQGNLQYQATTDTWRFAINQYDFVGAGNANISDTYDGWIDLIQWGAGNNPTTTATYKYQTFVEFGSHPISNGGNVADAWRTLTKDEWVYIFRDRTNAESLFAFGSVNGVNGLIILPDNWTTPDGLTFSPSTEHGLTWLASDGYYKSNTADGFSHNVYTLEQWTTMENQGAVFLPAAGIRYIGTKNLQKLGTEGYYWSSDKTSSDHAYVAGFGANILNPQHNGMQDYGQSIRLVQAANSKPTYLVGDANGNGEVEIGDVTSVLTLMATPEATGYNNKAADANGNGEIEIGDVTTILTIMANGE